MTQRTLIGRTFVRTTAALGATTALAGCSGGGDGGDGSDGSDGDSGGQEFLSEEPDYEGFLDDAKPVVRRQESDSAGERTVAKSLSQLLTTDTCPFTPTSMV